MREPSQWVDDGPEYDQRLEHTDGASARPCAICARPSFGDYGENDLVLPKDAAALLGVPVATLESWARDGMGPRVRQAPVYQVGDLFAFLERRTA